MVSQLLWDSGLMDPASKTLGHPSVRWLQGPLREMERISLPRRLALWLGVPENQLAAWNEDLRRRLKLGRELRERWKNLTGLKLSEYLGGVTVGGPNEVLYLVIRALRPSVVVETGVAAGFSTAYILAALAENERGKLYSIDVCNENPRGYASELGVRDKSFHTKIGPVGLVVPERFRSRWELISGISRNVLVPTLERVGTVEVFFHDSDHSYSNMMFEFRAAWSGLSVGGALLSDDVVQNRAFSDLASEVRERPLYFFSRGGLVKRKLLEVTSDRANPLGAGTSHRPD